MIKIAINYENFEGEMKEDTLMFNLNKTEVSKLELKYGGLEKYLSDLKAKENGLEVIEFIEELVIAAYGEIGKDGESFVKTPAIVESFRYGAKLPEVMVKLLSSEDGSEIAKFLMGCMSAETRRKIMANPNLTSEVRNAIS